MRGRARGRVKGSCLIAMFGSVDTKFDTKIAFVENAAESRRGARVKARVRVRVRLRVSVSVSVRVRAQ